MKGVKEPEDLQKIRPISQLLVTTSAKSDSGLYFSRLALEATIFPLSVAEGNFEYLYIPLIINSFRVLGSVVAPGAILYMMLEFTAVHDIKSATENLSTGQGGYE